MGRFSRDWSNRIEFQDDRAFRFVSEDSHQALQALLNSGVYQDLVNDGLLIGFEYNGLSPDKSDEWIYSSEKLPHINHPFEWCFQQWKDAGLVVLEIQKRLSKSGFSLKDGTVLNVSFVGGRPLFFDFGSISFCDFKNPWPGHYQFYKQVVFPLVLAQIYGMHLVHKIYFPLDGINYKVFRSLIGLEAILRHWTLIRILFAQFLSKSKTLQEVSSQKSDSRQTLAPLIRTLANLKRFIQKIKIRKLETPWSSYIETRGHYTELEMQRRRAFCIKHLGSARCLVLDIGTNTGEFSIEGAKTFNNLSFVSVDSDAVCIESLYEDIKKQGIENITPLILDYSNPSSGFGWQGTEYEPFFSRVTPDFILAMAVAHHLIIRNRIPLREIVSDLARSKYFILEVPHPGDKKLDEMLRPIDERDSLLSQFEIENVEKSLNLHCLILDRLVLSSRTVFFCQSKQSLCD